MVVQGLQLFLAGFTVCTMGCDAVRACGAPAKAYCQLAGQWLAVPLLGIGSDRKCYSTASPAVGTRTVQASWAVPLCTEMRTTRAAVEPVSADHNCGASMYRQKLTARPCVKLTALQSGRVSSQLAAGTCSFKAVVPGSRVTAPGSHECMCLASPAAGAESTLSETFLLQVPYLQAHCVQ